jgi:signal transduction histidine kinase
MYFSAKLARIVFITTSCVLLVLCYSLFLQVKDLIASYNQINKANIVKLKLEETLSTMKDAEIAQRGFLLTKDSLFLQPYFGAHERSKRLLSDLQALLEDHADQSRDLNALATFVDVRFRTFTTVIEQYNHLGISPETKKGHLLKGKSAMDTIRSHVDRIVAVEDGLLKQTQTIKRQHSYLAPFYAFLFIITALGILVFFYDKTMKQLGRSKRLLAKLRKLNGRLRQKNMELELYNKELDSFSYIASHDLKEPLRKITTFAGMIEDDELQTLSQQGKLYFQRIKQSVRRMQNLLDDLLLYSHSTKTSMEFEYVDLNSIINVVKEDLVEEITENKAQIHTSNLPVVKGLPFQLKQLFENLVINSIKYRQETVTPCINIEGALVDRKETRSGRKRNAYYRIVFKDNGLGFEQAYAEKIFQLFQRVHPGGKQKGTGIGLTICKKIVQNHHGYIRATSKVNDGTMFEIFLPQE